MNKNEPLDETASSSPISYSPIRDGVGTTVITAGRVSEYFRSRETQTKRLARYYFDCASATDKILKQRNPFSFLSRYWSNNNNT